MQNAGGNMAVEAPGRMLCGAKGESYPWVPLDDVKSARPHGLRYSVPRSVGRNDDVNPRCFATSIVLALILAAGCHTARGGADSVIQEHAAPAELRSKVIVHYFHRKVRCQECLAVEDLARRIVARQFVTHVTAGRLEFRSVLLDDPDNWHYVDEFLLTSPSLVVAEMGEDGTVRWKKLEKVWDMIATESECRSYVVGEIEEYLR